MHLQENSIFDLGVKVTRNIAQYSLLHVTYSATKLEVARSKGLGEDTFTRNLTDGWQTDFGTKLIAGIKIRKKNSEKGTCVYNKLIIMIVTWSAVQYHVSWISPYHRLTLPASRLVWSDDMI